MQIRSKEVTITPIDEIQPNPKNRNKHSPEQIERLVKIIEYQGFRQPLIVSNRSGLLVAGHGRLEAARKLKMREVPVIFQDFESEEQEYAAQVSDNAIASWAELDLSGINTDLGDLGPDFNIDLLGIKSFVLDVSEIELPDLPKGDKPEFRQMTFTLHDEQADEVERAIALAKSMGPFIDTKNENSNGNAIARVCEMFLGANGDS